MSLIPRSAGPRQSRSGPVILVLWDIDHTLVYSGGLTYHRYALAYRAMFGRELARYAPAAGRTDRAIILDTLAINGVGDAERYVEAFQQALHRVLGDGAGFVRERGHELPGALSALTALAHRPEVVQSVLTGNLRPFAEAKLAAFGLTGHLDLEVGAFGASHTVRAELVDVARSQAAGKYGRGFPGRATVLIGDTPLDVQAALDRGAAAVAVATGAYRAVELAAAGAHAVLDDLTDPTQVVAVILELTA